MVELHLAMDYNPLREFLVVLDSGARTAVLLIDEAQKLPGK